MADKTFCNSVESVYREKIMPKGGIFTIRNVKIATWFFVAATILTMDFELDGVNIFPDILVIAFMIPALVYFRKSTKISVKAPAIMMGLYALSAILSNLADTYYQINYTYNAMEKSSEAFATYLFYVGTVALQGIIFVILLLIFSQF